MSSPRYSFSQNIRCLVRETDHPVVAGADDLALGVLLEDGPGFRRRDEARGAVDRLGNAWEFTILQLEVRSDLQNSCEGESHVQSSIRVLLAEHRRVGTGGDCHFRLLCGARGSARRKRLLQLLPVATGGNPDATGGNTAPSGTTGGATTAVRRSGAGDASGQALSIQRAGDTVRCHHRVSHQHDDREGAVCGRVRRSGIER